eukprot:2048966-Karenia_brevis.AAC.1
MADKSLKKYDMLVALRSYVLYACIKLKTPLLKADRESSLVRAASDAQRAANANDSRRLVQIVKSLEGKKDAPLKALADEQGNLIQEANEAILRWR